MFEDEAKERVLGPVAVVAGGGVGCGEEGAVAAVRGFDERDVRVGLDGSAGLRQDADEGIVECVQDQCGNRDVAQHACGGGAMVVVVRTGEAGVLVPLIYIGLASAFCVVLLIAPDTAEYSRRGLGLVALGLPVFFLFRNRFGEPRAAE